MFTSILETTSAALISILSAIFSPCLPAMTVSAMTVSAMTVSAMTVSAMTASATTTTTADPAFCVCLPATTASASASASATVAYPASIPQVNLDKTDRISYHTMRIA